ncbi:response regulator [Haloferula sp. BvORR071]|uniref:response regulator n=1 Tax=Haloferula sp. BvORR071 TaxID=1396141 RepID=UPI000552221A|nr:response regulator [Haloferula sp. BvORR071]
MILDTPLPGVADQASANAATSRPLRILVAEDGKNAAEILALFFEMEGHEVGIAYDGLQAVELSQTFQPDIILMDIGMPKMDGVEAARRIRTEHGNDKVCIAILSGLEKDDAKRHCTDAHIDAHLAKPVVPDDLRSLIRCFRESSAACGS